MTKKIPTEGPPQCRETFHTFRCGGFQGHHRSRDGRAHWGWKGRTMVTWEVFSKAEVGQGRTT